MMRQRIMLRLLQIHIYQEYLGGGGEGEYFRKFGKFEKMLKPKQSKYI